MHLAWKFDFEKKPEGLYGNMKEILQFWNLVAHVDEGGRFAKASQVS